MASIIRVGQSKFVTTQIDEDSNERIMNCIQTLSELDVQDHRPVFKEVFLDDTRKAFEKMLNAQEVRFTNWCFEGWQCNSFDTYWFIETRSRKEGGRKQESCRYASWRLAYVPSIFKEDSRWHDWCTYGSPPTGGLCVYWEIYSTSMMRMLDARLVPRKRRRISCPIWVVSPNWRVRC